MPFDPVLVLSQCMYGLQVPVFFLRGNQICKFCQGNEGGVVQYDQGKKKIISTNITGMVVHQSEVGRNS